MINLLINNNNKYVPDITASVHIKQNLTKLKGKVTKQ